MKGVFLLAVIMTFTFSCYKVNETKRLDSYLQSFGFDLQKYKVICIVPADGCGSCIYPAIDYLKKADKNYLLVLSSIYKKSINYIIESKRIEGSIIVSDSQNLAASSGLVSFVSPCFYFLKNGRVVKIVDLNLTYDKTSVLKEVDKYLSN